jgi:hypothetical protein
MRISKVTAVLSLAIFLITACPLKAQGKGLPDDETACRTFVQGFYDWYVSLPIPGSVPLEVALTNKRHAFSPQLVQGLKEVLKAEARDREVWLDQDPVLNSQDHGDRYEVRKISLKDGNCLADIYGVWFSPVAARTSAKPDVVAELTIKNGRWCFVNFHYPDSETPASENLVSMLKWIEEDIQKQEK